MKGDKDGEEKMNTSEYERDVAEFRTVGRRTIYEENDDVLTCCLYDHGVELAHKFQNDKMMKMMLMLNERNSEEFEFKNIFNHYGHLCYDKIFLCFWRGSDKRGVLLQDYVTDPKWPCGIDIFVEEAAVMKFFGEFWRRKVRDGFVKAVPWYPADVQNGTVFIRREDEEENFREEYPNLWPGGLGESVWLE